ncbi:MAG: stress-responsive transcriptional regulator [Marinilabiliales bacterium]|nr:MAG: stress-responsive transcriptional regulator [Marinilabiliales bacterium]
MNEKKLTRSQDKVIAGVCAGIAEYFGWDIALVRILYLIISIFSAAFPGIIVYIILWIVMPEKKNLY